MRSATPTYHTLTTQANLYAVSHSADRITCYNSNTKDRDLLAEVLTPNDITFLNKTTILVTLQTTSKIAMLNSEGDYIRDFATSINNPIGLILIPNLNLLAVAESGNNRIFFFNTATNTTQGPDDAVSVDLDEFKDDDIRYIRMGDPPHPTEVLIATDNNNVIRICFPGTSCDVSRNRELLTGGGHQQIPRNRSHAARRRVLVPLVPPRRECRALVPHRRHRLRL